MSTVLYILHVLFFFAFGIIACWITIGFLGFFVWPPTKREIDDIEYQNREIFRYRADNRESIFGIIWAHHKFFFSAMALMVLAGPYSFWKTTRARIYSRLQTGILDQ